LPKDVKKSAELQSDMAKAYQALLSHFNIEEPDSPITEDMFNDPNSPQFQLVLFLYQLKPSIHELIENEMTQNGLEGDAQMIKLVGPFMFCLWRVIVFAEMNREGPSKDYLNYYEWPIIVYKGAAMTSEQIQAYKELSVASQAAAKNKMEQLAHQTLLNSARTTVFYGEALRTAYLSSQAEKDRSPVIIQMSIKDQARMAGFRVNFSRKVVVQ